jgi:hypothetical protein
MAVTSNRSVTITLSGDKNYVQTFIAAANNFASGADQLVNLVLGANTITVPLGGSTVPTSVVIIPPSGNVNLITLKGVTGDTGVALHKTDPTQIAIDSSMTTFVLNAAAAITGVRIFWT